MKRSNSARVKPWAKAGIIINFKYCYLKKCLQNVFKCRRSHDCRREINNTSNIIKDIFRLLPHKSIKVPGA